MQGNTAFAELRRALTTFEPRIMEEEESLRIRAIGFPQYSATAKGGSFRYECQQLESTLTRLADEARPYLTSTEINELSRLRDQLRTDRQMAYAADEQARTHEVDFWLEVNLYFFRYRIERTWQPDHLRERPYVFCFFELAEAFEMSESVINQLLIELNRSAVTNTAAPPVHSSEAIPEPKTISRKKPTENRIHNFEGLFLNQADIQQCVDALKRISPPVVSDDGKNWIGPDRGGKSILVAWIEALEQASKIKRIDRVVLSGLLNQFFTGLTLDTKNASIFTKVTATRNRYLTEFQALLRK